jgi:hypothetical protein|tara:strand:+ start:127 stop:297 length:171 start_codon:yes stop_codon:yes gene_type:complete
MKLDITEVHFVKTAIEASTIKASDAFLVAAILGKVDKEFEKLQAQGQKEELKAMGK